MLFFNHTTRFGNSFNLIYFQHILEKEFNIISKYPNGINFSNYFDDKLSNKYCNLSNYRDVFLSSAELTKFAYGEHIPEDIIHKITTENEKGFFEAKRNEITILSTSKNCQIPVEELNRNGTTVLNRAHYFHIPNIVELKKKHQESFRQELIFKPSVISSISETVQNYISNDYFCVGLHMRRTDYKDYLGGIYYFDIELYKRFSEEFIYFHNKKTVVFIFTDDKESAKHLESEHIKVVSGDQMQDFVTMTKMNLLVGPPSSFSNASSFIGKVPRHITRSKDDFLSASSPEKITSKKWFPHVG